MKSQNNHLDYSVSVKERQDSNILKHARWSWACRKLDSNEPYILLDDHSQPPKPGDVVVVKIKKLGYHVRAMMAQEARLRLYPGDILIGVLGNRYATDAYEAEVKDTENLQLLTGAGMIGSVLSKNKKMKSPTQLSFLSYLGNSQGKRINLKELCFQPVAHQLPSTNILFVIGSGMSSGKTTTVCKLVKGLINCKLKVAVCKLTGSVSQRDQWEYYSTGAEDVREFSDYGFPSTYLCSEEELIDLFFTMMTDSVKVNPDIIVVEIADGILQRETRLLLQNQEIKARSNGVILTTTCSASALYGSEQLKKYGHEVIAVSGVMTNSLLYIREFQEQSKIPVGSSAENNDELALILTDTLGIKL